MRVTSIDAKAATQRETYDIHTLVTQHRRHATRDFRMRRVVVVG